MHEIELFHLIADKMDEWGIPWFHVHEARGMRKGFPDLVIIGTKVLYRELKDEVKQPTKEQTLTKWQLQAAGQDFDVWRPQDLASGRIARELQAVRPIAW